MLHLVPQKKSNEPVMESTNTDTGTRYSYNTIWTRW